MPRLIFIYRSNKPKAKLTARLIVGKFSKNKEENTEKIFDSKLKLEISKEYWNNYLRVTQEKNGKLVKAKHKQIRDIELSNFDLEIRTEINNIKNFVLKSIEKFKPELITKESFVNIIENYYNQNLPDKEIPNSLIHFIDYYIEERKDEVTISSIKKFKVVKHKLERFQTYIKRVILISDINEDFKNEFVEYCKIENYALGTIQRDLVFITTFCNYAQQKGLEVDRNINKLRIKVKREIKHPYLNIEELKILEKFVFSESFDNVRDWLLISCNTGQRISDFMNFSTDMIREEKGKYLLEFKQQKTNKQMTIPLFPKVVDILKKRNWSFPKPISDQKYNDYLKVLCREAGINEIIKGSKKVKVEEGIYRKKEGLYEKWELVSSHIGRRSFATNNYGEIPTNYLIYMTGHSTEQMFLQYIGKSNKDLAMEIHKYF